MNLIKTKNKNPKGFYEIIYYDVNGKNKLMFIDDNILCSDGKPYFSRSDDKEIWDLLMEKSLARYERGFSNLSGGLLENAFKFWTGKKCTTHINEDFSEKSHVLHGALKSRYVICVGSMSSDGKTDQEDSNGIYFGHSYAILDVRHYTLMDTIWKWCCWGILGERRNGKETTQITRRFGLMRLRLSLIMIWLGLIIEYSGWSIKILANILDISVFASKRMFKKLIY